MTRLALWIASVIAAALLGAGLASAFCLYHWTHAVQGALLTNELAISAHYGALAEVSRAAGDEGEYDKALRAYVKILDTLLAREQRSEAYPTLAFDKAVTLARVGLLNEKRGNAAQAQELLRAALAACESSGRRDCTPANVRNWGARLSAAAATEQPQGAKAK